MGLTNANGGQAAALLGRRIAGYVLDEVRGAGGMGAIYGATSRFVKKRAAVKVMLNEYTEDSEVVGRFLQEAFVASAVDHPNVVEIWAADRFEEDGRMYILMPLIEGASLQDICDSVGQLGLDATATIAIQIAAGLDAVHELGVVHRDIKPANILITKKHGLKHFVKIVDFGVARLLAPHLVGTSIEHRTRTDMVIGTAGSMAPEQAAGSRDVDVRADIYSWGVILYRMLTGRPPYQGGSVWELIERARQGEPFPRPSTLRPDIPRPWEDVIMATLEFYPNRRPGSLKEVVKRIVAPLPNGDAMLTALGPNLIRNAPIGASEKTLTGDLEDRWSRPSSTKHRTRSLPLVVAFATGVGATAGLASALLTRTPPRGSSKPARPEHAGNAPSAPVANGPSAPSPPLPVETSGSAASPTNAGEPDPARAVTQAGRSSSASPITGPTESGSRAAINSSTATGSASATSAPAGLGSAATGSATAGSTAASAAAAQQRSPVQAPASGAGAPTSAGAPPTASQPVQPGMIIVRSSPWAKVWIDGESLGQTAVRKVVKPGVHKLKLVGPDDQTKELTRDVKAGETVPIRWDW